MRIVLCSLSVGQVVLLIRKGASLLIVLRRLKGIPLFEAKKMTIFPEHSPVEHLLEDNP